LPNNKQKQLFADEQKLRWNDRRHHVEQHRRRRRRRCR
jgi:hypothetical protein